METYYYENRDEDNDTAIQDNYRLRKEMQEINGKHKVALTNAGIAIAALTSVCVLLVPLYIRSKKALKKFQTGIKTGTEKSIDDEVKESVLLDDTSFNDLLYMIESGNKSDIIKNIESIKKDLINTKKKLIKIKNKSMKKVTKKIKNVNKNLKKKFEPYEDTVVDIKQNITRVKQSISETVQLGKYLKTISSKLKSIYQKIGVKNTKVEDMFSKSDECISKIID